MEIESESGSGSGPQDGNRAEDGAPVAGRQEEQEIRSHRVIETQPGAVGPAWGPFKYCPKCGAAALRATGAKLLRCAACGFELYLNVAAAVAGVIVDEQGRMVVLVRGKEPGRGRWDLPGGFVDPGDTAEEALRREVREEIGLEVAALRYLGSWPNVYEYMGVRYRTLDLGFACETTQVARARPREDEVAEVLFLASGQIDLKRFAFPSVATIARTYLEQGAGGARR